MTGAEIAAQVAARLRERSETRIIDGRRVTTFYYPMPDGSVRISYYGPLFHACGVIAGEAAQEVRARHPQWFVPEG